MSLAMGALSLAVKAAGPLVRNTAAGHFRALYGPLNKGIREGTTFSIKPATVKAILEDQRVWQQVGKLDSSAVVEVVQGYVAADPGVEGLPLPRVKEAAQEVATALCELIVKFSPPSVAIDTARRQTSNENQQILAEVAELRRRLPSSEDIGSFLKQLPPPLQEFLGKFRDAPFASRFAEQVVRSNSPIELLIDWFQDPPAWFNDDPGNCWVALGLGLSAYGDQFAAYRAIQTGVEAGVENRDYWRCRMVLIRLEAEESPEIDPTLLRGSSPFTLGVRALLQEDWAAAIAAFESWTPEDEFDRDLRVLLMAGSAIKIDSSGGQATGYLESRVDTATGAGVPLVLAKLLVHRAVLSVNPGVQADLQRASRLATSARDSRRRWRGPSIDCVLTLCDALALMHDWGTARRVLTSHPNGEATSEEASDPLVKARLAVVAASTGQVGEARALSAAAGAFESAWIEAILLDIEDKDVGLSAIRSRWADVLAAAVTDHERVVAARGVLMFGGTVPDLNELKARFPGALQESEELGAAFADLEDLSDDKILGRLRRMRTKNLQAAVRLAEILRVRGSTDELATVLAEAADRFHDQQLRLMAASAALDAQRSDLALELATDALSVAPAQWASRLRAHQTAMRAGAALNRMPVVIRHAWEVLELAPEDEEARWALIRGLTNAHRDREAYDVLVAAPSLIPADVDRARLRLHLIAEFGTTRELVRDAVASLRRFGDDESFGSAVLMNMVVNPPQTAPETSAEKPAPSSGLDGDDTDLGAPEDLGELACYRARFFEQFPESTYLRQIAFENPDDPVALLEQLKPYLPSESDDQRKTRVHVETGAVPLGFLCLLTERTYTEANVLRGARSVFLRSANDAERAAESTTLAEAIDQSHGVVVDPSAANTLCGLSAELSDRLLAMLPPLKITAEAIVDIRRGRDALALRMTGSMGLGPDGQFWMSEVAEEIADAAASRGEEILDLVLTFEALPLVDLAGTDENDADPAESIMRAEVAQPWISGVREARSKNLVLWSDDLALRRLARGYGVRSFGTDSLVNALVETGSFSAADYDAAVSELIGLYAVDLSASAELVGSVAAEEGWKCASAAWSLSRPFPWIEDLDGSLALVEMAMRQNMLNPEESFGWASCASQGISSVDDPAEGERRLSALVFLLIRRTAISPSHVRSIVTGARQGSAQDLSTDFWARAVRLLRDSLREDLNDTDAAEHLMTMISDLDEDDRREAVHAVIE